MEVEYHRLTVRDLNEAVAFYESERTGLGEDLRNEIRSTIGRIVEAPAMYPKVRGNIRRCLVHRFPFSILYRLVGESKVRILVIRHHRRHQEFGSRRR